MRPAPPGGVAGEEAHENGDAAEEFKRDHQPDGEAGCGDAEACNVACGAF